MTAFTDAVQHLQEAKNLVSAERVSLSAVGRTLSPQEQRMLNGLTHGETDIGNALNHLQESTGSPTVELPTDGRYTVGNDALAVELRLDVGVANVVSGDIFASTLGQREHLASFRSRPGMKLTRQTNPFAIVAENQIGQRAQGELTISGSGSEITVLLTLRDQIRGLPVDQSVTLVGRLASSPVRELGIELETEKGVGPLPEWDFQGRKVTVESCLENAGFTVFNVGRRSEIPTPSGGKWHDSQLHALMYQFAQEPLDRKSFNLHLLLLQESKLEGLLGIMFDSGSRDVNQLPRQGAAVFVKPIKTRPDWQRKLIQTAVHELGHALNLAHRFERVVGRADSLSFMNYDWKYLGGDNAAKFWRDFAFGFDPDELAFLRHGPWHQIIPGGAEFHTVPYWENTEGGYVPYIPEVPGDDFRLQLLPPQSGALFQFAQPVLLTVELTNTSGRNLELPLFMLDPKAGFLEFVIKRRSSPGGPDADRGNVFRPILHRCFDLDLAQSELVPRNGKISNNVNLTFGSAGFTFAEPGDYEVTAVLTWPKSQRDYRTYKSDRLPIRIAYPKTVEEEKEGLEIFRWDVGYYFALGGSDVLSEAEQLLESIRQRRQAREAADPLAANILRCQAINLARDFISYKDGEFSVRSADSETADQKLAALEQIRQKVFDRETADSTARLAADVKEMMKK